MAKKNGYGTYGRDMKKGKPVAKPKKEADVYTDEDEINDVQASEPVAITGVN